MGEFSFTAAHVVYITYKSLIIHDEKTKESVAWRWLYIWYKILLIYINFNFDLLG